MRRENWILKTTIPVLLRFSGGQLSVQLKTNFQTRAESAAWRQTARFTWRARSRCKSASDERQNLSLCAKFKPRRHDVFFGRSIESARAVACCRAAALSRSLGLSACVRLAATRRRDENCRSGDVARFGWLAGGAKTAAAWRRFTSAFAAVVAAARLLVVGAQSSATRGTITNVDARRHEHVSGEKSKRAQTMNCGAPTKRTIGRPPGVRRQFVFKPPARSAARHDAAGPGGDDAAAFTCTENAHASAVVSTRAARRPAHARAVLHALTFVARCRAPAALTDRRAPSRRDVPQSEKQNKNVFGATRELQTLGNSSKNAKKQPPLPQRRSK